MAISTPLGLAIGSILGPISVRDDHPESIDRYLAIQAGFAVIACILSFFLKSHPPTAPAATAAYKVRNSDLMRDIKSLRHNFGFLALTNIFSLSIGALIALLTLMEQILRPKGYSSDDAGLVSAVLILCGIIGCGVPISLPQTCNKRVSYVKTAISPIRRHPDRRPAIWQYGQQQHARDRKERKAQHSRQLKG
jgi:MFS transporter, FLVCR family, MFS-domain-containing protein 7